MPIDSPSEAHRLARAIASDVLLYDGAKLRGVANVEAARAVLAPAIAEARALFESRVSAEHHAYFDDTFDAALRDALEARPEDAGRPPEQRSIRPLTMLIVIVLALIAAWLVYSGRR